MSSFVLKPELKNNMPAYDILSDIDKVRKETAGLEARIARMPRGSGRAARTATTELEVLSTRKVELQEQLAAAFENGRRQLRNLDFSSLNLSDLDLHGVDFTDSNFFGAKLDGCDLTKANLHGADVRDASMANIHGMGTGSICDMKIFPHQMMQVARVLGFKAPAGFDKETAEKYLRDRVRSKGVCVVVVRAGNGTEQGAVHNGSTPANSTLNGKRESKQPDVGGITHLTIMKARAEQNRKKYTANGVNKRKPSLTY